MNSATSASTYDEETYVMCFCGIKAALLNVPSSDPQSSYYSPSSVTDSLASHHETPIIFVPNHPSATSSDHHQFHGVILL
jgi:hypothetical protein